jgi:peptide/nickel transport system substrate-binding protein
MLSIFTQNECLNWSDTCWSDPEYEELYKAQLAETDVDKRHEIVAQMQDIFYREAPEQFLFYLHDLQAVRSDKWEGFVNIPEPNGGYFYSWGPHSYINIAPKAGAGSTSGGESGGGNAFLLIGIAAVVLVGIGLVVRARARKAEDDA